MKLQETINKYFNRENIIDSISKYQLYYQIGLVHVALKSTEDLDETYKKLDKLNLQINPQKVFESVYEIIVHMSNEENFEEVFEKQLRLISLVQMLDDFINANKDIKDAKSFSDTIYEEIKNNKLFNEQMQQQFDNDYETVVSNWKLSITDAIATEIQGVVSEIFKK